MKTVKNYDHDDYDEDNAISDIKKDGKESSNFLLLREPRAVMADSSAVVVR